MKMSRREAIQLGLSSSGAIFLTLGWSEAAFAECKNNPSSNPPFSSPNPPFSPQFPPFQLPFQAPHVLQPVLSHTTTDYYEIVVHPTQSDILPQRKTRIWSYNGTTPGSTIRQQSGFCGYLSEKDLEWRVRLHSNAFWIYKKIWQSVCN